MPIKIIAAPGDHRNDFEQVEQQANEWIERTQPRIVNMSVAINQMPGVPRESGNFMMTLVVHYEMAAS